MMTEYVTIELCTGIDGDNNLVYAAPDTGLLCRIQRSNVRALSKEGRDVISHVQVILADPSRLMTDDDRVTLPDGTPMAIIAIESGRDEFGPFWLEIRG
jgi:hypothetical protein